MGGAEGGAALGGSILSGHSLPPQCHAAELAAQWYRTVSPTSVERHTPTRLSMIEKGDGFEGGSHGFGYPNGHNGHSRLKDSPPLSPTASSPTSSPKRSSPSLHPPPLYPPSSLPSPFSASSPFPMPPFSRGAGDYLMQSPIPELHYTGRAQSYSMISPNDPTANACKVVEFHGEKIAAFHIHVSTFILSLGTEF